MAKSKPSTTSAIETVEPIGQRVLIRKDEDKKITKVGIHLPDKIEIPTLTGRIVAISAQVANDDDYPIQQYDKVLFNPKHGIPVDFEGDNRLFVIPIEDVVAVFRKELSAPRTGSGEPRIADPHPVARPATPLDFAIRPPGSKSITCRAFVLAALAGGESRIVRPLRSADTDGLLDALAVLGAGARRDGDDVVITGVGGRFPRGGTVDLGDGGTPSRFMLAAACLAGEPVRVDGSPQMRGRPVGEGVDLLRGLGGKLDYLESRGHLPVLVTPTPEFRGGVLDVPTTLSSQYISALLLIGRCLPEGITLRYSGPVTSGSYVDLTVDTLAGFDVAVQRDAGADTVSPGPLEARMFVVDADASSAIYWCLAAALTPGGRVTVEGIPRSSRQADLGAVGVLAAMGAGVQRDADAVRVTGPPSLAGVDCDCAAFPDGALALGAAAALAGGPTTLRGLRTLRYKESDRIAALATELGRLGCGTDATDDTLTIDPSSRHDRPVTIRTYDDHRMAMAFAILGLARGGIAIENPSCVGKSYPGFWDDLEAIGAV